AVAALDHGESFVQHQIEKCRRARETLAKALESTGRCRFSRPDGAFYLFFGVEGMSNSMAGAKTLVDIAGVGLAPGDAFGPGGAGHLRLCYLRSPAAIDEAAEKLVAGLKAL
ncbi:MAG: hypothetical protein MUE84_18860, partial [Hyphomonas sp.]|nr:hypothetical protein [Hyphomonas sp.]